MRKARRETWGVKEGRGTRKVRWEIRKEKGGAKGAGEPSRMTGEAP